MLHDRLLGEARRSLDEDARHLAGPGQEVALGGVEGEGGVGDAAEAVGGAEGGDADDPHPDGLGRLHRRGVAHVEVPLLGRATVDDDLVGRLWRPALDQPIGVEVGVVHPVGGLAGRAVAADGLAVLPDESAVALDRGLGLGHAVDSADAADERRIDGAAVDLGPRGVDLGGAAHDGVGALGDVGEQGVEVGADGVAEGEGPRQERHAEEHREEDAREAALAGPHALEADLDHGAQSPRDLGPASESRPEAVDENSWMRSSTRSWVGSSMRSTRRPSARKSAPSA